jgi:hypothetical protein
MYDDSNFYSGGIFMIKHTLLGLATLLALTACSQPGSTTPTPVTTTDPVIDISKLVGTWKGEWRGQDGLLATQSGTMELVVAADGKTTCTLTNAVLSGKTTECSGSAAGNTKTPNTAFLTATYKFTDNPKVTATGNVFFLAKDTAVKRTDDAIIGSLNNVADATTDPKQYSGDLGNLYFNIKKS